MPSSAPTAASEAPAAAYIGAAAPIQAAVGAPAAA